LEQVFKTGHFLTAMDPAKELQHAFAKLIRAVSTCNETHSAADLNNASRHFARWSSLIQLMEEVEDMTGGRHPAPPPPEPPAIRPHNNER